MAQISFLPVFVLLLVIAIIIGTTTKKWSKAGYFLSGVFFLIAVIWAISLNNTITNDNIRNILILFGAGFFVNSLINFFNKK